MKKKEEIIKIVEDYEARLRREGAFVTHIDFNLSKKSLQDFLIDFFYYNHLSTSDTLCPIKGFNGTYTSKNGKYNASYSTPQCRKGARRSAGDLFQIALGHYSNDITLIEVMEAIMKIVNDEIALVSKDGKYKYQMYSSVCSGIHRRVFNATTYGGKGNYKFSTRNPEFSAGSDTSYNEFTIVMEDYLTLDSTGTFKSYREQKESERNKISPKISKKQLDDIDKLIAEKIAKLLEDSSDKVSLIKKAPLKKKRVLV